MRVLLINPPEGMEIFDNNPVILSKGRGYNPPMGLLYVAAYLEAHRNHEISVIDCQVEGLDHNDLSTRIGQFRPDVIGITATTMTLLDVIETIKTSKEAAQGAKIVLGGPHVNLFPEETVRMQGVDFVVLGEGEHTFTELLDSIDDPSRLRETTGLVFKQDGKVVFTPPPELLTDLNELPFPARHLTPFKRYSSVLAKGASVTTMITSRGCPFKCAFCDRPHLGKRFRARSADDVVDEIELCTKMGINEFLIYDDTFTVNRNRVLRICDQILRRKLDIFFDIRARVDTVDEEMIKQLKKAGCQGVHYGVEAGTERILKVLNKGITCDQIREAFRFTKKHNVPTLAYIMIGNPTESIEEIQSSFDFIKSLNPDYLHLTVLCPFPGTQTYREALSSGIITHDVWKDFVDNPRPDFRPPHWGEFFSREELFDLAIKGYRQFYLRPSYILRRLMKLRSLTEFSRNARGGLLLARAK